MEERRLARDFFTVDALVLSRRLIGKIMVHAARKGAGHHYGDGSLYGCGG